MFPEFRDLISQLKTEDEHFARLFRRHNEIDQKIINMESTPSASNNYAVEQLKKEKLQLKDSLYDILKKASHK